MAVIVNNPGVTEREYDAQDRNTNAIGSILGMILLVAVAIALLYYGLPALRSGLGAGYSNTPSLNVPSKIDVNVNQPK